jgi:hypothetical protein
MDLWIQPCAPCADLHGRPAVVEPHDKLTLVGTGAVKDAQTEQRYTCMRCGAAFVRVIAGEQRKQIWLLLNAGQH